MADGLFIEPLPEDGWYEEVLRSAGVFESLPDQNPLYPFPAQTLSTRLISRTSAGSPASEPLPGQPALKFPPDQSAAESLLRLLTSEELRTAAAFGSSSRRREYLAWRAVVRREVGADAVISYNGVGAPVVENYPVHISVSHCRGYVAVCISDLPCAVDIERPDRDFGRVVPRYLSPRERALSSDPLFSAVAWCAKEALYKLSGRAGLDLLQDLHVEAYDAEAGKVTGRINGEPIELSVCRGEGFIAVYFH